MNTISSWRVRIIGSFVIALVALAGYLALIDRTPSEKLAQEISGIRSVYSSLETTAATLTELPDPSTITPQTLGSARDYNSRLLAAAPYFNTNKPRPQQVRMLLQDNSVKAYNQLLAEDGFNSAYSEALTQLEASGDLLAYHIAVMSALQNLLEYQPAEDTSNTDKERLLFAVQTTGGGLEKTNARLDTLPSFADDTMPIVRKELETLEQIRKAYEVAIESGQDEAGMRTRYIDSFTAAQRDILANRDSFWTEAATTLSPAIENARRELNPYLSRLNNL